ncbi:MAG: ornithine carbamoyltransferase [Micavibrio aeruginosavorus]|uniref:Ornithine carbamoyltransferase n=1 Tax=Micavibrio aeruginosavorus TaxID=349221 RepID=A0A2W5FNL6_9BACT|nr:MAG: ornithine carbamoyltransferase [Micavibrio aeruginosavorus]
MTKTKHFINLDQIPVSALMRILAHAHELKAQKYEPPQLFRGMSLAMIFDKKSTRTRLSFEIAFKQLGGHVTVMTKDEMQLGVNESVEDTAKVLSRFVDAIMIRLSDHDVVEELASYSNIPVINALTDRSHPCQIMADLMTIEEKKGNIAGLKLAWVGDYNNVAKTFMQVAPKFGFNLEIASPTLEGSLTPQEAVQNADVVITDTWVSMGEEGKAKEKFWPYQVNAELMALAKQDAIFMHCMPIHRGEEVTNEVLDTEASVIYDEAENRLHVQKAILAWCLENSGVKI